MRTSSPSTSAGSSPGVAARASIRQDRATKPSSAARARVGLALGSVEQRERLPARGGDPARPRLRCAAPRAQRAHPRDAARERRRSDPPRPQRDRLLRRGDPDVEHRRALRHLRAHGAHLERHAADAQRLHVAVGPHQRDVDPGQGLVAHLARAHGPEHVVAQAPGDLDRRHQLQRVGRERSAGRRRRSLQRVARGSLDLDRDSDRVADARLTPVQGDPRAESERGRIRATAGERGHQRREPAPPPHARLRARSSKKRSRLGISRAPAHSSP